jgi:hypothetical protein
MNAIYITIVAVVLVLVIMGVLLALIFIRQKRAQQLHDQFGAEYDHTVEALGNEKKAQVELKERQEHLLPSASVTWQIGVRSNPSLSMNRGKPLSRLTT